MTTDAWVVRPLSDADVPELLELDNAAFHIDQPADFLDGVVLPMLEVGRMTGVRDPAAPPAVRARPPADGTEPPVRAAEPPAGGAGPLVGTAAVLTRDMTFPGARPRPVAAITFVAVRGGWRRRGILRALMRDQLHGLHERGGEAVAVLTASEGVLYGRYGYGRASDVAELRLPHGAPFAASVPTERVREIDDDTAAGLAEELWARIAPTTTGFLTRPNAVWRARFTQHEFLRRGSSQRRWAAHPDGVIGYRVRPSWLDRDGRSTVVVTDLIAATPVAHASLWRFVLDLDLTDRVEYALGWPDDPVQDLLVDRRALSLTPNDHVWLRIVNLDRAVGLRGYPAAASVDVEIVDDFCPWNAGVWHFDLGPSGGRALRSAAAPQLTLHVRELAACFLGGTRLTRLAAGGLVGGDFEAIGALSLALSAPLAPWCPEIF